MFIKCRLRAWAVHRTNQLNEACALHHSCLGDNSMWRLRRRERKSSLEWMRHVEKLRMKGSEGWCHDWYPVGGGWPWQRGQLSYNPPSLPGWSSGPGAQTHRWSAASRRVCLCNKCLSVKTRLWIISSVCVWGLVSFQAFSISEQTSLPQNNMPWGAACYGFVNHWVCHSLVICVFLFPPLHRVSIWSIVCGARAAPLHFTHAHIQIHSLRGVRSLLGHHSRL